MTTDDVRREMAFWQRFGQAPPEPVIRVWASTLARCYVEAARKLADTN